jgi:hypothetical protein
MPTHPADKEARAHLPKEAEEWEFIGAFRVKDGGKERMILLYQYDTDLVAKWGSYTIPNSFALHAVYHDEDGKWLHRDVYHVACAGFQRIVETRPEGVTIELAGRSPVTFRPGEDVKKLLDEANKPFQMRLTFENGVPTLKWVDLVR